MVLIAAILSIAALAVILLWILVRGLYRPARRPWVMTAAIVAGLLGIVLSITAFERVSALVQRREWPTVEGEVISSTVVGERSYVPAITYEFEIGGVRYTGTSDRNVPLFGNRRRDYDVARKEAARYPEGSPVKVYYDPANPANSTIMPEPRWNDYAQTGLGVFLFAVGLFLIIWPKSGGRESDRSRSIEGREKRD